MATLSAGHLFTDIAQGSIPALLPFLIAQDHLNYAAASALVLAATISSSIISRHSVTSPTATRCRG
jgi:FSR family fosmidomycin resistance protein-like MFS transporter